MRVFGIDPGSLTTGYGVIEKDGTRLAHVDNGVVRPKSGETFSKRLENIFDEIGRLLDQFKPDVVALEDAFFYKDVRAAMKLGHVRGIAMLAAVSKGLEVVEYAPSSIKQAVTGFGHATKAQVQKMVRTILKLPDVAAEDASDALAVAICHLNSSKLKQLIENGDAKKR
jgi:crossover junction endodeoxyribonuclease RuvC